jgi:hypothetical protein
MGLLQQHRVKEQLVARRSPSSPQLLHPPLGPVVFVLTDGTCTAATRATKAVCCQRRCGRVSQQLTTKYSQSEHPGRGAQPDGNPLRWILPLLPPVS